MPKIASPAQLQSELTSLLEYSRSPSPSRVRITTTLMKLADGVAGNMKMAAGGSWSDSVLTWMADFENKLAAVISSSIKVAIDDGPRS